MKRAVNVTLDEAVLFEMNRRKPLIPRSAYVEHLLRIDLGLEASTRRSSIAELEP